MVQQDGTATIFIVSVNGYKSESANEQTGLYPNVATLGFRGHATQAGFNGDEGAAVESAGGCKNRDNSKIFYNIKYIYISL